MTQALNLFLHVCFLFLVYWKVFCAQMFTVSAHVILCIIFTFSNNILQTCIYRICKHEKAQIFASSLSNKKGIFSVFYIASS